MNLKVEWANNPTTFAEVEDWNAVTLKHLNPKKRKDLQHIIDSAFIDLPCAVTSEDKIEKVLCKGAEYTFALSLLSLLASLIYSLVEIFLSTRALELELSDMEELEKSNFFSNFISGSNEKKDL